MAYASRTYMKMPSSETLMYFLAYYIRRAALKNNGLNFSLFWVRKPSGFALLNFIQTTQWI